MRSATLMILAVTAYAVMGILVRLAGQTLHPFEIAFFRSLIGALFVVPIILSVGLSVFRTHHPKLNMARSLTSLVALLAGFTGLAYLPTAEAMTYSFPSPLFVAIGASLFLAENVTRKRWLAIAVGFAGVLIVMRPGGELFHLAAIASVLGAAGVASSSLIVKRLTGKDSPATIVTLMSLAMTVLTLPFAVVVWQTPTVDELVLLTAVGVVGTIGHFALVYALRISDASLAFPYIYLRLPIAAGIAFWLFQELPSAATLAGSVVIAGSVLLLTRANSERPSDDGSV